jgi:hypothetical protein
MRYMRIIAIRGLLAGASFAVLTTPPVSADATFTVPRSELITTIKTIGVMPVEVDDVVPDEDGVASRLEQDIATRLQLGGFTVVPPSAMRAIRARGQASLGGVYDQMTGAPIRERMQALEEFSTHEYRTQHPVGAMLRVKVLRRQATFQNGSADWDGVRERVTYEKGVTAVLQRMMSRLSVQADVPALSLAVSLVDSRGETVYTGFGGLLVLMYPTLGGKLVEYDLSAVNPKFAMGDPSVASRALTVALDPLTTGAVSDKRLSFTLPPPPQASKTPISTLKDLLRAHPRVTLAAPEMRGPALEQGERVQAHYRALLAAKFTALGFDVAGGNDFDDLWAGERADTGGFYDRLTGRLELTKLSAARARVLATLRERYNVSAVIMPSIVARQAPCSEAYARWDGARESVTGAGSFIFNESIFNPGIGYSGDLDALSLKLRIVDDAGKVLYEGFGGVQLTTHLDRGRIVRVPEPSLFADPAGDARAVDLALESLMTRPNRGH